MGGMCECKAVAIATTNLHRCANVVCMLLFGPELVVRMVVHESL